MDAKEMGEMPAYPQTEQVGERGEYRDVLTGGMTIRQRAAIAAMQGILANPGRLTPDAQVSPEEMCAAVGRASTAFADALLAELAKEPT
jgi:hypothetical protein